jgi:hypothetical protein
MVSKQSLAGPAGLQCGKDDLWFQWERSNLAPLQHPNDWTNLHHIWHDWLGWWDEQRCLIWWRLVLGERLAMWVKYSQTFSVFFEFFSVLWHGYIPQLATEFDIWWLNRRGLAQGCAFWVSNMLNLTAKGYTSSNNGPMGISQPMRKCPKILNNFVKTHGTPVYFCRAIFICEYASNSYSCLAGFIQAL